ncbi:DUF4354 family protein [Pseudomonas sp. SL4(2022)]|uniref:DUF4354 family protein n=1 Tax=Pseudomonas sp. SL4(2022) TaxID=2994661 RepID=UPI00226F1565|nr:DUF4354 family protein [Pseudomonas sp. SL4(2022)]WAC46449.1 DUF4354 family protein [Pseudomonas sp. SL4(2022)]
MSIKALTAIALSAVVLSAHAERPEPTPSLFLMSTYKNQGSIWANGNGVYFKAFDASLLNTGKEDVDLSKLCFQAYDAKGNAYGIDTIDESLSEGILKEWQSVRGFYQFTGEMGVLDASMVKASYGCPLTNAPDH